MPTVDVGYLTYFTIIDLKIPNTYRHKGYNIHTGPLTNLVISKKLHVFTTQSFFIGTNIFHVVNMFACLNCPYYIGYFKAS